jgi:hypothetical protein
MSSRAKIAQAIEEASRDEPFTMPLFLVNCLVGQLRRQQNLTQVTYSADDFSVLVKLKKPKTPKLQNSATPKLPALPA